MEILDADRLAEARAIDARYHVAKLAAQGGVHGNPDTIWQEHEAVRAALFDAPAPVPTPTDFWATVGGMHARLVDAGLIPPNSGGVN